MMKNKRMLLSATAMVVSNMCLIRRCAAAILASIAVCGVFDAFAATERVGGITWTYTVSNGKATVGGGGTGSTAVPSSTSSDKLEIPSMLGGYEVVSIGNYAFYGCRNLRSVTIPSTVKNISEAAFLFCRGLTSVSIPSNVTIIGDNAFDGCVGLKSVTIQEGVKRIGNAAFNGCTALRSVTIPSTVTSIGTFAFSECGGLGDGLVVADGCVLNFNGTCPSSVTLPQGVRLIADGVFKNCTALTNVTIPSTVTVIGTDAFSGCSGLGEGIVIVDGCVLTVNGSCPSSVVLPDGVRVIAGGAFRGCSGVETVTIPSSVTSIGAAAFSTRDGLSSFAVDPENPAYCSSEGHLCTKNGTTLISGVGGDVTIPSSVTRIGDNAFECCVKLTSVTIPSGVTNIGEYAFYSCKNLKSVTIPSKVEHIYSCAFMCCGGLESVTISEGVTSIGSSAFSYCARLESMTIPSSVKSVDVAAFSYCTGLKSVSISSGMASIAADTFFGCSGLESVTISPSVASISATAFSGCRGLKSVTIPACVERLSNTFPDAYQSLVEVVICEGVTSIGSSAFYNCSGLKSVTIPSSVTSIGSSAFYNCSGLEPVTIPEGVTNIGSSAFYCSGLKSVTIPVGVTRIGSSAFSHCSRLESVTIPEGVKSIGDSAFCGCRGLESVTMPEGVMSIGSSAFSGCSGLKSVTIPSSVTSIGNSAFYNCRGLESVTMPEGVMSIGSSAFSGCSGLKSVTIPSSVTSIGPGAFSDCSGLESVTIREGVTNIGSSAFSGCRRLKSVTIPSSVTSIESSAFSNCVVIETLMIASSVTNIGDSAFSGCSGLETLTIPSSVTVIGSYAFSGCSGLETLTIPSSVTDIGSGAFSGCSGLKTLTIPEGVTDIESYAFSGCSGLESLTIPSSLTNIGDSAFSGCSGLETLTIPSSVTSIGPGAFSSCSGLKSVTIPSSVKSIGNLAFSYCRGLESLTIPEGVTSIGEAAFCCSGLKSVTIPEGVTSIGSLAFYYCDGLESVATPSSVKHIGDGAFWGCCGLKSVTIPPSVTSIGDYVFDGCSGLESVTIPSSVTSIGSSAFFYCSRLESVTIPSSVTSIGWSAFYCCSGLKSVTIPPSVTSIGDYAFSGCSGLESVTIPSSATSIGSSAFSSCGGLMSVTISEGVKSIGSYAFYRCGALESVTIPSSVTSIGDYAFSGCSGLESVTIPSSVTSIGSSAFSSCGGLMSVTISEGVKSIGSYAFYRCGALESVTIPSSVTSIGESAFSDCCFLSMLVFEGEKPSIASSAFSGTAAECLLVPKKAAFGWGVSCNGIPVDYFDAKDMDVRVVDSETGESETLTVDRGVVTNGMVWSSGKVYVVDGVLLVGAGGFLEIQPGAVVKFTKGSRLVVSGGLCSASGVVFTHIADDTVGGDTNDDGQASAPSVGEYLVVGIVHDNDRTDYRYLAPQELSSSVNYSICLRGRRTYLANSSITVTSGATLTILPGAIIKFASGCSMTVNGTLDAQGTRAQPIVFTSVKDDEWGGDINGDEDKTYAQAGDWHQITGVGTVKMNYCQVLWCSAQNNEGALYTRGGTWTFDNSVVAHCQYDCMRSCGGTFNANNSVFMDSSMGAAPQDGTSRFVNCVFYYLTTAVRWGCGSYYNCIFANIAEDVIDTKFYSETVKSPFGCCCFWVPNATGDWASAKVGKDGNIWGDPKFVDPDNGDFRIAADSPCVDAGDGTVAPKFDYYGQPRMDANRVEDTGVPSEDGVCPDIGIYEVMGKTSVLPLDMAILSVSGPTGASVGDEMDIRYVVTNCSESAAIVGYVRDRVMLRGADSSLGGQQVMVSEVVQPYSLAAGATATLMARVKCPTVKSGNWTVGVTVNAERDVFEQMTANNTGWATEATAVELETLARGENGMAVAAGATKGFVFGEGVRTLRVASDAALDKIAVYGANGAVPPSPEGGTAAVRLGDGSWLLVLPEATADEKGYVVIENSGATEVALKVTVEEEKLVVCGVAPSRIAAVDGVSVTITGTGLAEGQTVTLGGRTAMRVTKVNEAQIVATFDLKGMAAGAASVEVRGDGVPPSQGSVEIYKTTQGPKLEASLKLPSSVRDGRIYTAYVVYANVGDEPMTMPVFKVARTDSSTKIGLTTGAALTETKVFVGGISPNYPAGVLQPGDGGRIPVFFMPSGTYGLKLTHTKETDNTEQFPAFGGVKPYLAAMSAAATRLNLRGKIAYNVHDFVDQAEAEKNGVPCAAVSGTVRNATTAEVLSGVAVALVSTNGLGVVETVTDENGYFQLSGLADGIYHFNLAGEYELDSASVGDIEITGQADRNDIGVLVRVGGCVKGTVSVNDGVPVEGARVFIEGDSGKIEEVTTDVSGGYAFTRIFDGAYKVGVCGTDGYAGEMKTNVVVDAVNRSVTIDFCLARGGVVRGEVTGIGTDVTNGCVWAMTVSGDIISATCDERGGFEFPGLAANTYTFQYQSAQHVSDISTIDVLAGATRSVNLSAQARPLFRTTQKIGFGSLETSFVFEDYNRSTNITSWAWDFNADGKVDSRDPSPTHTYTAVGTNTVVLTFVEDGVTYSTTNVACAIVEEPIETVYTDKAIVIGVNAGSLAAVELTAGGVLVLTGTPDRTLTVGDVVVGAIGDDGFARRVLGVKGDSTRWELQTEDAPIEDVFVSVGMAGRSVQRRQVRRLMAANKTSANVLKAASSESSGGSGKKRFYTEGGGSFDFNYDFDVSIDYALKRLNGKTYWRIVPILTFERTIKSEFQIGAGVHQKVSESAETPPVLCITAGPIPVPVVTGHFEVEFYASWDVGGKFVGGSEDFVRDTFKYGYEYYEGQLNVVKDHNVDHDSPKSQWDVEGSANVEVGAFFGFKLRALAVMSASIGPKLAFGIKATESLHSPSKVSIYGKLGVEAEANLIDLDFNLSPFDYKRGVTWFWGNTSDLVSYTGPTADFSMTPPSGEAPLHVDFSYTGAKEKTQFLWWEKEYTPWKLSWNGTNWDGDPDGKLTESEGDYNSEAKWPVKLSVRGHVMNVLWPKTKTKYVIVGDPEETPDDGDDTTDDGGGGTPAKSCDPNEMAGPLGAGDPETQRFVKPGEWMDYTIYFENKADADVPAQEVTVDAQLSEYLDWSTFEMGEVAFNNQNETVLAGLKNGLKTVAQNGADYKVQLSVEFDETTGAAHWYLRSYDPNRTEYNNWPAAVDAGFLPPNDETHRGEGHITYRVKVREDAPNDAKIDAAATIIFDQNPSIKTDPSWWNTVAQAQGVKVTVDGVEKTLDLIVGLPYGKLPDPGTPPEGHSFGGWFTQPDGRGRQITAESLVEAGDVGLYQYWRKNGDPEPPPIDQPEDPVDPPVDPVVTNTITYLGVEGAVNTNVTTFTTNDLPLVLGPVEREGYEFLGWTPNGGVIPSGTTSNVTFTANWTAVGTDPVEPVPPPTLFGTITPTPLVSEGVAYKGATYNGFLGGEDSFGGTFTLVVKKPKKGETAAAATLTKVNPATGKKEKVSGTVDVATGVCAGGLEGLVLNEKGVGGKLGNLAAQGSVDAAKAKDTETLDLMNGFDKSVYSVVLMNANGSCALLTATFSKKGKVKVAGTVDGFKVSCSAQMSVGDRYAAVPFAYAKPAKGIAVSAVLWFDKATKALVDVTGVGAGIEATAFGDASAPASGEYRFLMAESDVLAAVPNVISNTAYEVKASFDGKKYDAGKAAKVKYDKKTSTLAVDTSKGTDVSGLKLKYAKGAISGSFTVYEVDAVKDKLVKNKFTVNGVIVNGVGHGLGTNKKLKPIPIEVTK